MSIQSGSWCGRGSCGVGLNGYFLEHSHSKDRFQWDVSTSRVFVSHKQLQMHMIYIVYMIYIEKTLKVETSHWNLSLLRKCSRKYLFKLVHTTKFHSLELQRTTGTTFELIIKTKKWDTKRNNSYIIHACVWWKAQLSPGTWRWYHPMQWLRTSAEVSTATLVLFRFQIIAEESHKITIPHILQEA